jgi:hypothetical protein
MLTQACRLLVKQDRRPEFHGRIAAPVWKTPGIAAEQLAVCAGPVLLVVGRVDSRNPAAENLLIGLDAASGRQLWKSDSYLRPLWRAESAQRS